MSLIVDYISEGYIPISNEVMSSPSTPPFQFSYYLNQEEIDLLHEIFKEDVINYKLRFGSNHKSKIYVSSNNKDWDNHYITDNVYNIIRQAERFTYFSVVEAFKKF